MVDEPASLANSLEAILPENFRKDLSDAEKRMLSAVPRGVYADCAPASAQNSDLNPAHATTWGDERQIRAELISWLSRDGAASKSVAPRGILISHAKIIGQLNLSFASVPFPLRIVGCLLAGGFDLQYVKIPLLDLGGTLGVMSMSLDGAEIRGDCFVGGGFSSQGLFRLLGAQIGGDLDCSGGIFRNPGAIALAANDARIAGNVLLSNGFSAEGGVQIPQCHIGGSLNCDGGMFANPGAIALSANGVEVEGNVILGKGFSAEGEVSLVLANIRGSLVSDGTLRNPGKIAMIADSAVIGSNVVFDGHFSSKGEVRLQGAQIAGDVDCDGHFNNPGKETLNLASARVKGDVYLIGDFLSEGKLDLGGIHIDGDLSCNRAKLRNPDAVALKADRAHVSGSIFLEAPFSATGEINLIVAKIEGNLECEGGRFNNPGGLAMSANSAEIGVNVFLNHGFSAMGDVNFVLARIGAELDCSDGCFTGLQFRALSVKRTFVWKDVNCAQELDLQDATVESLWDDMQSWQKTGKIHLNGFQYGSIKGGPTGARERLAWLARQTLDGQESDGRARFASQPYLQLAKVLRDLGDEDGAKQVLIELEGRTRAEGQRRLVFAPERWLRTGEDAVSKVTVGYGIYPVWAIRYIFGMSLLGWLVYRRAKLAGAMAPTDKDAYAEFHKTGQVPEGYPPFNPLIYSIENCVPLVKLGQDDRWQADPNPNRHLGVVDPVAGWLPRLKHLLYEGLVGRITSPTALRWTRWILIALGWLLATFFVAGVTGSIRAS